MWALLFVSSVFAATQETPELINDSVTAAASVVKVNQVTLRPRQDLEESFNDKSAKMELVKYIKGKCKPDKSEDILFNSKQFPLDDEKKYLLFLNKDCERIAFLELDSSSRVQNLASKKWVAADSFANQFVGKSLPTPEDP